MFTKRLAATLLGCLAITSTTTSAPSEASIHDNQIVPTLTTSSTSDYEVSVQSITLTDVSTSISDIASIHNGRPFEVYATLHWTEEKYDVDSTNVLYWELSVNGEGMDMGSVNLNENRALPTTINAGQATITTSGSNTINVRIMLDTIESSNERAYMSFNAGASFWPLVVVIAFAIGTKMVELALGMGIFVGACMVAGSLVAGFRDMLDIYLLNALADKDHGYVFLFILFMAGLVGLIEKSGGLQGITAALRKHVKTARTAQGASFLSGLIIFFDDYANTLVAGASMRPLTDACAVSREKLAFIVDATAAPIASIVPISSWVGFEISLIQDELNRIVEQYPDSELANTSAFAIFLETIKYRYYCIFMLMLIPLLVLSGRDMGPMLIAERLTRVYGRTDGGPGRAVAADGQAIVSHNAPLQGTPAKWWNMVFPIVSLIFYIFYLLVWTGAQSGVGGESFIELIELSNSYQALLWGTMAAALTGLAFYFIQDKKDGRIIFFNVKGYVNKMKRFINRHRRGGRIALLGEADEEEDTEEHAKILMNYKTAMSSFLIGMEKIFGACVVLTLAWATGAIMQAVGLNRLFGEILTDESLDYRMLPTLTFIIAILIALSTGTSWGTMTIMFPLVLVPSYEASNGDPVIFYGVTAGILAGAVAGDHASPISDTTILSSMASECEILQHVRTQAPYVLLVSIWSVLVGTIPSGRGAFANWVSILLGFVFMLFHVVFTSEYTINKSGRYDIFTELYLRCTRNKEFLMKLKEDTKVVFETGEPIPLDVDIEKPHSHSTHNVNMQTDHTETERSIDESEMKLKDTSKIGASSSQETPELHTLPEEPVVEEDFHDHSHQA